MRLRWVRRTRMGFEARVGREGREKTRARTEGRVKMARNERIFVLRT